MRTVLTDRLFQNRRPVRRRTTGRWRALSADSPGKGRGWDRGVKMDKSLRCDKRMKVKV